ncbi:EF-hand domain-containing protein [Pseudoscourfieldia marina]
MSAEMTYLKVSSFPKKVQPLLNDIDDEKNGKIEMDELTDILTVYADLKKANKEGSIAIKTLPKEIQPTLKVFDVDGDGTVAPMELARGAELYKESKKTTKRLTIFSGILLVILCALVGVIVGLTAVVVEASKETKTDSKTGITFAKGSGKPSAATGDEDGFHLQRGEEVSVGSPAIGSLTLARKDLADKEEEIASLKKDHADKEKEIAEKFQKDLADKEKEIAEKFEDLADKRRGDYRKVPEGPRRQGDGFCQ